MAVSVVGAAAALGSIAGCYNPVLQDGAPCNTTAECPGTQTCQGNVCVSAGAVPDSTLPDAASDASSIEPDTGPCQSFSTLFDTCALTFTSALEIATVATYNTDTRTLVSESGSEPFPLDPTISVDVTTGETIVNALVLTGFAMRPNASLRVTGSKPLALIVDGAVSIQGVLDLHSDDRVAGAGARSENLCGDAAGRAGPTRGAGVGAPGGGGGALGGRGGDGQNSDTSVNPGEGGRGGRVQTGPLDFLGGCRGGRGGSQANTGGDGGAGGAGGGAVYVAARESLEVTDLIYAGGAGGAGGTVTGGGGGGGGSGGMIFLEAGGTLDIRGTVAANGGGGGGGAGSSGMARRGEDGRTSGVAAVGGTASAPNAGAGGMGSSRDDIEGGSPGVRAPTAGGGGGGGAGFVVFLASTVNVVGVVSPPPTPLR